MDHSHKTWLWRKKSTDRMIVASDKVELPPTRNEEEIQNLLTANAELEKDLISLNSKLSACLSECHAKDVTIKKHVKMAEEAMAGWEKAEARASNRKQELDFVSRQRAAAEERSTNLEGALKECMRQLHFVRQEQEQRIHDSVMKASTEFERSEKFLEEKLAEASQQNEKLVAENTHLSKVLLAQERSNEDLIRQMAQVEQDLNALVSRLQSYEKENASLKYEVRVLEKELEIRNEEREFNRRAADVSHRQHLESVKMIAKLESECQRLRLLVRKRLPGPVAMAKMRSEVDSAGKRRTKSGVNGFPTDSTKQVSFLTEQLFAAEAENKSLKEALEKQANELQVVKLEHFKHGKQRSSPSGKTIGASEISLMDDFAEMERLAVASTDKYISKYSSCGLNDDDALLADGKSCNLQADLGGSILKIIELVEGVTLPRYDETLFPYMNTETSEYTVRVFHWKTSELGAILQKFVQACYDLLNGISDVSSFAEEVTSALDWVMNHCFSIHDVSSMKDAIKKYLDLDETLSESETEVALISQPEVNTICHSYEKDGFQHVTPDENMKLNEESVNIKFGKGDLEAEIETKNSGCNELELTCLELQHQLESVPKNTISDKEEKHLRSDREITAASEKLAECQETILKLEKQFKALATSTSPNPVTPRNLGKQRSSLLDQMLAEDRAKMKDSGSKSPKTKQIENDRSVVVSNEAIEPLEKILVLYGRKLPGDKTRGANLWRKLLWRKKKSGPPLPTSSHGQKQ